jgi:hypothetical protein
MSRTIRPARTAVVTIGALAALAGTAVAADAPVVGPQTTFKGAKAPVSVPGNHLHRGDRIPKGAVLVLREVRTTDDTAGTSKVVLTLPKGKRLTGVAVGGSSKVAVRVANARQSYVGRRRVTLEAIARKGHPGTTTVYGYGR